MSLIQKLTDALRICLGFIQLERAEPSATCNRVLIADAQRTADVLLAALERARSAKSP